MDVFIGLSFPMHPV